MLRRLMLSTTAILLMIVTSSKLGSAQLIHHYGEMSSLLSVNEGWTRSDKQDDIEAFYRYEKTGSDKFQVEVKIVNNRSKAVKVQVQVLYASGISGRFFTQPSQRFGGSCEVITPSGGSRICRGIKVTAKKINGVKIIRWDNVDEN